MTKTKSTKRALLMSGLALLACVSMLVGSTFAWFTDSVTSSGNIIKSGTLEVEMRYADGNTDPASANWADASDVAIFNYANWEPGYVDAKHLQIANVGSLAFNYYLRIVANGVVSQLADVIDVYYFADAKQLTRADVESGVYLGTMTDVLGTAKNISSTVKGMLKATESKAFTLALKMKESAGNEYQNLSIGTDFSVELIATQASYENDSFDNKYDLTVSYPEVPAMLVRPMTDLSIDTTGSKLGMDLGVFDLDVGFQFEPTAPLEAAQNSDFRYWHADFVVSADSAVAANSLALAGYYDAWCSLNNDKWVALTADMEIPAGEEIRLVSSMASNLSVNYEELCHYGNDGIGFRCGAVDLDGSNEGTTLTVELRLYETEAPSEENGNSHNEETGRYITVGVFEHTFGGSYKTLDDGAVLFMQNDGGVVLYDTSAVTAVDYAVPAGVTTLGDYSLTYNSTIKNVTLPTSVTSLGRAFDSNSTVEKVVLNEGLEQIDSRAFKATTALKEVVIPSTVKTIADDAFQKTGLKTITIPATVEYVGAQAFGASKIQTVIFEGGPSIQNKAFRGCADLRTVYINGDDVTFVNTTGQANCWFCNSESNNPNTSNITFYVKNDVVAARVKTAMGAEANNTPVIVDGVEIAFVSVGTVAAFQRELDDAQGDTIISLTADITGNVTAKQKANVDVVINGNGKTFTGVMTVFGDGRQSGEESLAIKNVNFVAAGGADACILSPDREVNNKYSYSHNVTVENCTFTDPDGAVNCAAIRQNDGGDKDWTVVDCSVDNTMHSLLQVNNVSGKLTVEGCTVNSKNGLNLNCCTNVEIIDCDVDVLGYTVRFGVATGGNPAEAKSFVIKESTLKSAGDDGDAVIIFRASAANAVLTLVDTTLIGTPEFSGVTASTVINR